MYWSLKDDVVSTQIMPQSIKPNFKTRDDQGSFIMKEDLNPKLNLKVNGQEGVKVFSPQLPKQLDTDSAQKKSNVRSVGANKKKSHFVFF